MLGGSGGSWGFKGRTRRQPTYPPILQSILLVLQLILLRWHSSRVMAFPMEMEQPRPIRTTFGNDKYYMVLDYDYDFLWEDKAIMKVGVIPASKKTTKRRLQSMAQLPCK